MSEQKGIFQSNEFYLQNTPQLADKLIEHGAKIVQNPTETTFCVIAPALTGIRVKNLAKEYDIIKADYFERCITANTILDYSEEEIFQRRNNLHVDQWRASFLFINSQSQ